MNILYGIVEIGKNQSVPQILTSTILVIHHNVAISLIIIYSSITMLLRLHIKYNIRLFPVH